MNVLVLNPGSSTLKFRLFDLDAADPRRAGGVVEHVEGDGTSEAARRAVESCRGVGIDAVGCRVVHGGPSFTGPALVTPAVIEAVRDLGRLAPLHNPVAARVLESTARLLPGVPLVAVFDTAFHRTIPDHAGLYALPLDLSRRLQIHRYGAHGTSHRYVSERLVREAGLNPADSRVVTLHLGNGCSACAVRDGRSIDTSMGLTPLEGLVMGTRSGDLDPAAVLLLQRAGGLGVDEVDRLLNHESGLLGLGGRADVRDLLRAAGEGDARARLALDVFCYRVRKYVGAYAAALEGLDALAFTGGIGEHAVEVRASVLGGLGWLGVRLDAARNAAVGRGPARVSADGSPVQAWVIPTDEELQIARETAALVRP